MGEQHASGEINPFSAAEIGFGRNVYFTFYKVPSRWKGILIALSAKSWPGASPTANFMALTASTSFPFAVSGRVTKKKQKLRLKLRLRRAKKPNEQLNFEFFFGFLVLFCFFYSTSTSKGEYVVRAVVRWLNTRISVVLRAEKWQGLRTSGSAIKSNVNSIIITWP